MSNLSTTPKSKIFPVEIPSAGHGERPLVLMSNVDSDMSPLLRIVLERWGYDVAETQSDEELLRSFEDPAASLILMDTEVPFEKTLNSLDTIRHSERDSHMPCVLFSGFAQEDYRKAALDHGATGFLVKPVDVDSLETYFSSLVLVHRRHKNGGN